MTIINPSGSIGEQKDLEQYFQSLINESEHVKQRENEVRIMIDQTQTEINKLTQRNTVITSKLQQIQALIDTAPREDIQAAYDAALDGQQRLLRMRGQLEKLQNDQAHLTAHQELLQRILAMDEVKNLLGSGDNPTYYARGETVEMMIQAQESERQRLARQMHDGPAQALSNFILQTEIAMRLFDIDQGKAREELINLKTAATTSFQKVRDFIFELRPMMLDDL